MTQYFLTSDTHFYHKNIIKYANRPFDDINHMNNSLIDRWNSVVSPNDIVIHIGDFAFANDAIQINNILNRLNGTKWIITGNHDDWRLLRNSNFQYVWDSYKELKIGPNNDTYVLCHYPLLSWNKRHRGTYHFFGHEHSSLNKQFTCSKNSYDVGVDNNNYAPISLSNAVRMAINNPQAKIDPSGHHSLNK